MSSDVSSDDTASGFAINAVRLRSRDAERVAEFYERVVGLTRRPLGFEADGIALGAPGAPTLLEVIEDASAKTPPRGAAGLFHTAFLLPERADLAAWLAAADAEGVALEGAADHGVSEAVYLSDPDGNGVEVYADRPVEAWDWAAPGELRIVTRRLNRGDLSAAAAGRRWTGAPARARIGHVHLRVGNPPAAQAFLERALGFATMQSGPDMAFLSRDGYHHHIAVNSWGSAGATPRGPDWLGLAAVAVSFRDRPAFEAAAAALLSDAEAEARRTGDTVAFVDRDGHAFRLRLRP